RGARQTLHVRRGPCGVVGDEPQPLGAREQPRILDEPVRAEADGPGSGRARGPRVSRGKVQQGSNSGDVSTTSAGKLPRSRPGGQVLHVFASPSMTPPGSDTSASYALRFRVALFSPADGGPPVDLSPDTLPVGAPVLNVAGRLQWVGDRSCRTPGTPLSLQDRPAARALACRRGHPPRWRARHNGFPCPRQRSPRRSPRPGSRRHTTSPETPTARAT